MSERWKLSWRTSALRIDVVSLRTPSCRWPRYAALALTLVVTGAVPSYGAEPSGQGRISITAHFFPFEECDPPLPDRRCVVPSSHLWRIGWPSREARFERADVSGLVTARDGTVAFVRYKRSVIGGEQVVEPLIYVADHLGAHPRLLTQGDEPTWSPDAKRLAFVRADSVWIIRRSGAGARRLASGGNPTWSPSRRIAFFTNLRRCRQCIATINSSGHALRQVSRGPRDFEPAWSPRADRLAYVSENRRTGGIATIKPDGTGRRRLKEGFNPTWSPDGERIAFHASTGVFVMRADGSQRRAVIDVETLYPSGPPAGAEEVLLSISEWQPNPCPATRGISTAP